MKEINPIFTFLVGAFDLDLPSFAKALQDPGVVGMMKASLGKVIQISNSFSELICFRYSLS